MEEFQKIKERGWEKGVFNTQNLIKRVYKIETWQT